MMRSAQQCLHWTTSSLVGPTISKTIVTDDQQVLQVSLVCFWIASEVLPFVHAICWMLREHMLLAHVGFRPPAEQYN